jgi:hypothetical protein
VPDAWLPGWWDPGYLTVVQYDSPDGYPTSSDPGPPNRGANFFAGGWTSEDTAASWTVDLNPLGSDIDAGVSWTLTGWLGGYVQQEDSASVTASFRDGSGGELRATTIGPVTAADRGQATGLLERSSTGTVPPGSREVVVTLAATRAEGYNDGYADNLSLVLSAP